MYINLPLRELSVMHVKLNFDPTQTSCRAAAGEMFPLTKLLSYIITGACVPEKSYDIYICTQYEVQHRKPIILTLEASIELHMHSCQLHSVLPSQLFQIPKAQLAIY